MKLQGSTGVGILGRGLITEQSAAPGEHVENQLAQTSMNHVSTPNRFMGGRVYPWCWQLLSTHLGAARGIIGDPLVVWLPKILSCFVASFRIGHGNFPAM